MAYDRAKRYEYLRNILARARNYVGAGWTPEAAMEQANKDWRRVLEAEDHWKSKQLESQE